MYGGGPQSGRTANGISDANDTITDVAARQRLFIIVLHRTSVSDRLAMITPLAGERQSGQTIKNKLNDKTGQPVKRSLIAYDH